MRPDTLAQLMTSSNIQSGSKVIIVEHCQGLVVAAALERLAGEYNNLFKVLQGVLKGL